MREIKFRAWDSVNKRMIQWDEIGIELEDGYGCVTRYIRYYDGTVETEEIDDFNLMQYTGLKDKHGQEIYEGDIYKNVYNVIWKIYYDEKTASFRADAINRDYKGSRFTDGKYPEGEVIGNIHEHPELLGSQ